MRRLTLLLLALALVGLLVAGCDSGAAPVEGATAPSPTLTTEAAQGPAATLDGGTPAAATSDQLADDLESTLDSLEKSLQSVDTLDDAGLGD